MHEFFRLYGAQIATGLVMSLFLFVLALFVAGRKIEEDEDAE